MNVQFMQVVGFCSTKSDRLCARRCGSLAAVNSLLCDRCITHRKLERRAAVGTKVYAVYGAGLVKFGQTRLEVDLRLGDMQVGSPILLRLLGAMVLPAGSESRIHRLLAHYRVRGEWFRPEGHVLKVAAWLADKDRRSLMVWMHAAEAALRDDVRDAS